MTLFFILLVLVGAYAAVLLACGGAWRQLPVLQYQKKAPPVFFTVLLPVKDEAANILSLLQDLEAQTYPKEWFEVIVIDDHSTDQTSALVQAFQANNTLHLKLLFLASFPENRLKKGAITLGVSQAKGDWIACTDGDCRVSENWLSRLNQCRWEQNAKLISGPVKLATDASWFQKLQALEFSALIGVGAASIGLQKPTMCNGANLAYDKTAFEAVNGFAGTAHIPSGDDEFLMHKIHGQFPGKVAFLKDPAAVVSTQAVPTVKGFFAQRIRWASKWKHYESVASQGLALLVLGANVALLLALGAGLLGYWPWYYLGVILGLKLLPDIFLLVQVLGLFQNRKHLLLIGLLQVLYVPYIVATAVLSWRGTYAWKGRQHIAYDRSGV